MLIGENEQGKHDLRKKTTFIEDFCRSKRSGNQIATGWLYSKKFWVDVAGIAKEVVLSLAINYLLRSG